MSAVILGLTGCWQKSLHPFYHDKDVIFDRALLGEWREPDKEGEDTATWTFTRGTGTNVYNLHVEDKEMKLDYDVRLFKMGERRFLDLHSRRRPLGEIPAHHLFRLEALGETLKFEAMSSEWVSKWVRANPKDIAFIFASDPEHPDAPEKGEHILVAETDRLQKFVRDHQDAEGFFQGGEELKRLHQQY